MKKYFSVSEIRPLVENILELNDADTYDGHLSDYRQSHSNLIMTVHRHVANSDKYPDFRLIFDTVQYYEGPMWWNGMNIAKGTFRDFLKLYSRLNEQTAPTEKDMDDIASDTGGDYTGELLVIRAKQFEIKIMASFMILTNEPLDF